MATQHPIIIIGSGLAGYTLAKEFRKLDQTTPLTIITASDGRYYSKPLLSTALTKQQLPAKLAMADVDSMRQQLNAEILVKTRVNKIDAAQQCIYIGEQPLIYSKLVLACGADPIKPAISGSAAEKILSVNDLEDYHVFRDSLHGKKHIAILGAGLVGCEFANDLLNSDYSVSVIALGRYPLDTLLPEAIGKELQLALQMKGAHWHLQQSAKQIAHHDNRFLITLTDGTQLTVDLILSAIGLRPHTHLAHSAGIKINRGIVVDRLLQTSIENIYALGDCAEVNGIVQLFIAPLLESARTLAKTLAGNKTLIHYPPMPVIVKTPAFPLVLLPPPPDVKGEWRIEQDKHNIKAIFCDAQQKIHGFVLTGTRIKEKNDLVNIMLTSSHL